MAAIIDIRYLLSAKQLRAVHIAARALEHQRVREGEAFARHPSGQCQWAEA